MWAARPSNVAWRRIVMTGPFPRRPGATPMDCRTSSAQLKARASWRNDTNRGSRSIGSIYVNSSRYANWLADAAGVPFVSSSLGPDQPARELFLNDPGGLSDVRGRDDNRIDHTDRTPARQVDARARARIEDAPARGLSLPRGEQRERVEFRGRKYALNGSETRGVSDGRGLSRRVTRATFAHDRRSTRSRAATGVTSPSRAW